MFNTEFEFHNHYIFTTLDENGEVIESQTVYNTANPGLYVAQAGSYGMTGANLEITYHKATTDSNGNPSFSTDESVINSGVNFYRKTKAEDVNYGTGIEYTGSIDFYPSTDFVGQISGVNLGRHVLYNNDRTVKDVLHWSEGGGLSINKTSTMTLHVEVTLFMTAAVPSGKHYDANISSVLHRWSDNSLLTPLPSWVGLSSFDVSLLPDELHKKVPTLCNIPTEIVRDYERGTATVKNIVNNNESETFFISGTNSSISTDASSYNVGLLRSVVFGDVSVSSFRGDFDGAENEGIYIPAVILTPGLIKNLLDTYPNEDYFYFFCVPPEGATVPNNPVVVNGTIDNTLSYHNPRSLSRMTSTKVGFLQDGSDRDTEITSLRDEFRLEPKGTYYSQYILGNDEYWEPENGCPTSPPYVYFNSKPDNIRYGPSASVVMQAKVNGNWVNIGTRKTANNGTIYLADVDNVDSGEYNYRACVSAPQMNGSFFVNQYESSVLPHKSYDPYVICIGDSSSDFGKCGIEIPKDDLQTYKNSYIGISIRPNGYYKTSNTVAFLSCSMTARGA